MLDAISNIAEHLKADGFSRGDRIAICSENRIESVLLTLACWKTEAVVVPVSTRYPDPKLSLALETIHCSDLFISRALKKELAQCRHRILEDTVSWNSTETTPLFFEQFQFDLDAEASILFTSGSSGTPKGVLHTIGNHYYNALGALQNIAFEQGDRWLMSLPMYHISGFSLIMRSLISGGTLVFQKPDESVSDALIHRNISHLSLVPAQLNKLMREPAAAKALRQCKSILLGGAPSSPLLIRHALDEGFRLSTTYGLTELGSQVTTTLPRTLKQKTTSSGRVLPYRELKFGKDGEILLKGPTLFKGYVFKDRIERPLDPEGYFHSGDVGVLDEAEMLTVTGRKDRMFISGGENIHPEEIEKAILTLDSVEQVHVVPVPDATMGERPVAFIKMASQQPMPETETFRRQLQSHIERFKLPIAFLPWPKQQSQTLKPDGRLFRHIAIKNIPQHDPLQ